MELGDLGVKIKDIMGEGFVSSLAKSLLPADLQNVIDTKRQKADPSEEELAKAAYQKFGPAPGRKTYGWQGWLEYNKRAQKKATSQPLSPEYKPKSQTIAQKFAAKEKDNV